VRLFHLGDHTAGINPAARSQYPLLADAKGLFAMNLRTTYIFFGVLVVILLVVGLVQWFNPKNRFEGSEWVFPELVGKKGEVDTKDVESLRVERTKDGKSESYLFIHNGLNWELKEPTALRVESGQIDGLVHELLSARREKGDMTTNLADYGLDAPPIVLTLTKDGRDYTLSLGNEAAPVVYALSSANAKKPISILKSSLKTAFKPINELRDKRLIETGFSFPPSFVELKDKQGTVLELKKTGLNRWRLEKPDYGDADYDGDPAASAPGAPVKQITGVHELLNQIDAIRVEHESDFIAENVSASDMAEKYGLAAGKPDLLSITVKSEKEGKGETTRTLLVGKKADPDKDKEGKETKTDYYYARLENENAVVRVPMKKLEQLLQVVQDPIDLRDHNLLSLDNSAIDAVDVQNSAGLIKLRRTPVDPLKPRFAGPEWKLFRDSDTGTDADQSAVQQLLTALTAKRQIKTWPDPKDPKNGDKELEFDHPIAVISLWENGILPPEKKEDKKDDDKRDEKKDDKKTEKKDEKKNEKKDEKKEPEKPKDDPPKLKSEKPTVRLVFGKRDKDKGIIYVRRESGEDLKTTTLVTIPDTLFDKVTAGPLAYLSRTLPSFTGDPTRLTITRGGQTYVLEKGDKSYWTIKEPKEFAGRRANEESLNLITSDLHGLTATRLVTENPPDGDLHPLYDLKPPVVEVKLTVPGKEKDKPEEFIYQFGKETDDKVGVFAKMNKLNLVFVVPKTIMDNLQKDLRDPAIFAFEPSEVRKLKLGFWREPGEAFDLELERKEGGFWSVVKPESFAMDFDDKKAEKFVKDIAALKAEKTLTGAEIPKPDQAKFDLKAGALLVEITLAGREKPVQLTIGGEFEKKSYYVKSSLTGDDVFLVPMAAFEQIKGKPSYFKKQ
jgi:hypothetical protein